jgi:hypothetical protein
MAKAERIQARVVERLRHHKLSLPLKQFTKDGDALPKDGRVPAMTKLASNRRRRERKQRWEDSIADATPPETSPVTAVFLGTTFIPSTPQVDSYFVPPKDTSDTCLQDIPALMAPATAVHSQTVQLPCKIRPKASQLFPAFASVQQHNLCLIRLIRILDQHYHRKGHLWFRWWIVPLFHQPSSPSLAKLDVGMLKRGSKRLTCVCWTDMLPTCWPTCPRHDTKSGWQGYRWCRANMSLADMLASCWRDVDRHVFVVPKCCRHVADMLQLNQLSWAINILYVM